MKLCVIVPVFNECSTIGACLERIDGVALPKEIIVVDDGSDDGTSAVLAGYAGRPGFRLLRHDRNRGKGHAIRTGLELATGEVVVIQDADLEYDPADLPRLLQPIAEGKASVVYGSRRIGPDRRRHSGWLYTLGGLVVTYATRVLYGLAVTDEATCYKMLRVELLRALDVKAERFDFCPEVTAKLALRGERILEVPISYAPRRKAEGKKIGWRDGVEALWTLLRLRIRPR
jgi:hypothetical protein